MDSIVIFGQEVFMFSRCVVLGVLLVVSACTLASPAPTGPVTPVASAAYSPSPAAAPLTPTPLVADTATPAPATATKAPTPTVVPTESAVQWGTPPEDFIANASEFLSLPDDQFRAGMNRTAWGIFNTDRYPDGSIMIRLYEFEWYRRGPVLSDRPYDRLGLLGNYLHTWDNGNFMQRYALQGVLLGLLKLEDAPLDRTDNVLILGIEDGTGDRLIVPCYWGDDAVSFPTEIVHSSLYGEHRSMPLPVATDNRPVPQIAELLRSRTGDVIVLMVFGNTEISFPTSGQYQYFWRIVRPSFEITERLAQAVIEEAQAGGDRTPTSYLSDFLLAVQDVAWWRAPNLSIDNLSDMPAVGSIGFDADIYSFFAPPQ